MSGKSDRLRSLLGREVVKGPARTYTAPKERPVTTPDEDEAIVEENFTKGKWHHYTNHLCNACGVGFIDPATAVDHWLSEHSGWTAPPATAIVDTGLVAPSGDSLFKEVEVDPNTVDLDDEPKEADE